MDDDWGIDAEAYIEAIRAGALDPHGLSADELQASLDAYDAELTERLLSMSAEEVERGAQIPPVPPESEAQRRLRLDAEFAARSRALETRAARVAGEQRELMAAHVQRVIDLPGDPGPKMRELASFASAELGLSGVAVERRMTEAWTVVTELPAAHEAAAAGRITTSHLRVIEAETRAARLDPGVDAEQRDRVVVALVEIAASTSPGRLRKRAKFIVNEVLSEPLQVRHDAARDLRRVELFDAGDGISDLVVRGPSLELTAAFDRLTQAARGKPKEDPRSFDQFRADAAQELLLAGVVPEDLHGISAIRATVGILIPATTLLHDDVEQDAAIRALDAPASLDGRVLVDRDTARRIAAQTATWERLFTDPVTGTVVAVDSRRQTGRQKAWLQARDGWCRAIGCANPARTADVDHTVAWADGGQTRLDNLEHLCRHCHLLKHDSRWQVQQLAGGVLEWTSAIGQVLRTNPEPIGPVFTDLPRRSSEPTLTPAQKRKRRSEVADQMRAETARWNDPATRPEPGALPASVPWAEHTAEWTGPPPPF
ncbi:HNH endonuclease signature motif containing protein [Agrococcus citreus]|uniref:HNH nuclease domain-containing protein n=1 Tax=Agrococcus citreus TaxID=84643 RepID=A0ABP4JFX9_9MICO